MTDDDIVRMAIANESRMDGTIAPVAEICRNADVVFGVWPDADKQSGYDMIVVRGLRRLNAIAAAPQWVPEGVTPLFGKGAGMDVNAVLCSCYEQALVLQAACGEHQRGPLLSA